LSSPSRSAASDSDSYSRPSNAATSGTARTLPSGSATELKKPARGAAAVSGAMLLP